MLDSERKNPGSNKDLQGLEESFAAPLCAQIGLGLSTGQARTTAFVVRLFSASWGTPQEGEIRVGRLAHQISVPCRRAK
jgi:hypothetical protein